MEEYHGKPVEYWKKNAEEDYIKTPLSVLKYITVLEEQAKALHQPPVSGSYYSCMDCEWEGEITQCDFDTEYDEFKGVDRKYPICPKCGGGLDC